VFVRDGGSFEMSGGTISGNRADGGGVGVWNTDSFVKRGGGTIDAANSAKEGRVVYVYSSPGKVRNSAAGPWVNLDSGVAGSAGGWE
jgi:hypothetical protein